MDVLNTIQRDDRDGFELETRIVADYDTRPDEFDCYTDEQIEAWKRDEWQYVGVIVVASRNGHEVGSASLWGIDYGLAPSGNTAFPTPFSYAEVDVADELEDEAIADAWSNIDRLLDAAAPVA